MFYGTDLNLGLAIYYDRRDCSKPQHRMIFGQSGTGRHFLMKAEIAQILQTTNDTIYVIDANGEFVSMAKETDGCVISLTINSNGDIAPFDIPDVNGLCVLEWYKSVPQKNFEKAFEASLLSIWKKIESSESNADRFNWIYIDTMAAIINDNCLQKRFNQILMQARMRNCIITYSGHGHDLVALTKASYGHAIIANTPHCTFLSLSPVNRECVKALYGDEIEEGYIEMLNDRPCGTGLILMNDNKFEPFRYTVAK